MSRSTAALFALAAVVGALLLLVVAIAINRARAATIPSFGAPTTWRYCPDEYRTRAVVVHPDGSATCDDCGAHIGATEGTHA